MRINSFIKIDTINYAWRVFFPICVVIFIFSFQKGYSQSEKNKVSFKDSLDHKIDLSNYIIEKNGLIPIPIIITEPALGNLGGGLATVFIKKRPPLEENIKGKIVRTPTSPDITGGAGFYTANNTWGLLAFRKGTLVKSKIKYGVGGGYVNVNLSFYRNLEMVGEREFKFNAITIPVLLQGIKRIGNSNWYGGMKYLFLKTDLTYKGDPLLPPEFVKPREYNSIISKLGPMVELDTRDNIFTPDNGVKFHFDASFSDNILGSDYEYTHLISYVYLYKKISPKIITALRIDGQQVFDSPPFFMLPYINMRGIPVARYQGRADILSEGEIRWDFVPRWSAVFFGGTGKAFDDWSDFGSAKWITSYGSGFRYLIARKFKLRAGIDIARGPDTWAYYIVFGSSWLK